MSFKSKGAGKAAEVLINGVKYVAEKEAVAASKALPQWACQVGKGVGTAGKFILTHPKGTILFGGIGYGMYSGKGAVNVWKDWFLPKGKDGEGIGQGINRAINGEELAEKHGLLGATTDNIFGEGTTDGILETVDSTKEGIKHGYQATKDEIAGLKDQIAAKFDRQDSNGGSGGGNPQDQLQQYFQAGLSEENVQLLQLLQANGMLQAPGGGRGNGGGWGSSGGGILDGIKEFIGNLFSNKNSTVGAVGLLASLWGMFGRFGLLTKGAAALAGYWSLGKLTDGLGEIRGARQQQRQVPQLEFRPITASQNYERLAVEEQDRRQQITNRTL